MLTHDACSLWAGGLFLYFLARLVLLWLSPSSWYLKAGNMNAFCLTPRPVARLDAAERLNRAVDHPLTFALWICVE